jgi:hypothetical protein
VLRFSYPRGLLLVSGLALLLSGVFFLPAAVVAWLLEKDDVAWLAVRLVPVVPLAVLISGLLLRLLARIFGEG